MPQKRGQRLDMASVMFVERKAVGHFNGTDLNAFCDISCMTRNGEATSSLFPLLHVAYQLHIAFDPDERDEAMNRSAKRHRSTKVPNVKLRPAPAIASSSKANERRQQVQEADQEDYAHYRRMEKARLCGKARGGDKDGNNGEGDDDEESNAEEDDDNVAPLLGCVICMTGAIEEKAKLIEYATTMGAQIQGNLTEDATHLVAQEPGSEKYNCAIRLGLPILKPEWLKELRACWTKAIDYDFEGVSDLAFCN